MSQLSPSERASDSLATSGSNWPRKTTTDENGRYSLQIDGRGKDVDLRVLVIADGQKREGAISHADYSYLAVAFENPEALIGENKFALKLVLMTRGRGNQLDFAFE